MADGITIESPIKRDPIEGFFKTTKTSLETARSNLRNLMLTVPGERLLHKNLGLNPKKQLFENSFDKKHYKDQVYSQTSKYLSYLVVDKINIQDSEEDPSLLDNSIKIKVWFHLKDFEDVSSFLELIY